MAKKLNWKLGVIGGLSLTSSMMFANPAQTAVQPQEAQMQPSQPLATVTITAPALQPLISQCETNHKWKSVPSEDFSAMANLGKLVCTDQPFSQVLPEANDNRDKYFSQLSLAQRELSQKLQLGRAVQSGELQNVSNMFVTQKPYAGENGAIVYEFQLTVRRSPDEAKMALDGEVAEGVNKRGILTGLIQVEPAKRVAVANTMR